MDDTVLFSYSIEVQGTNWEKGEMALFARMLSRRMAGFAEQKTNMGKKNMFGYLLSQPVI